MIYVAIGSRLGTWVVPRVGGSVAQIARAFSISGSGSPRDAAVADGWWHHVPCRRKILIVSGGWAPAHGAGPRSAGVRVRLPWSPSSSLHGHQRRIYMAGWALAPS